ncbi:MAG: uL15 family ribosomal protein [Candidatus Pacebacteria bacterium]|nr:uL15 family ribosomal protein [Candidatus Paceibacterota bacterium]MBP9769931.1 uL15 family ribosomal protein [Candidatus Paceibacterota bacterium]
MQLHTLKRNTKNKKPKYVGRGGKRGKTSGKGTKGQSARAGRKYRPAWRDRIKKLPKLRGHNKNRAKSVDGSKLKALALNVRDLEKFFTAGEVVSLETVLAKKVVRIPKGVTNTVKILATGELTKALKIEGLKVSDAAKVKIEKAGGTIS